MGGCIYVCPLSDHSENTPPLLQAVQILTTKPRKRPLPVSSLQAAGVVAPPAPAASDAPPAASANGSDIPQGAAASIENLRGLGARARQLLTPALAQGGMKTGLLGRIKQGGGGGGLAEPTPRSAPPPPPGPAAASPNRYMERQEREVRLCRGGEVRLCRGGRCGCAGGGRCGCAGRGGGAVLHVVDRLAY